MNNKQFAKVYILDIPYIADKTYDYAIPDNLRDGLKIGDLAVVPFGSANTYKLSVVAEICETTECKAPKSLYGLPLGEFSLHEDLVRLAIHMKEYLLCTVGEAVKAMLPAGVAVKSKAFYRALERRPKARPLSEIEGEIYSFISENSPTLSEIKQKFGASQDVLSALKRLSGRKACKTETELSFIVNTKTESYVNLLLSQDELNCALDPLNKSYTPTQKDALRVFAELPETRKNDVVEQFGISPSIINALVKKNAISCEEVRIERNPYAKDGAESNSEKLELSEQQQNAYETLLSLYQSKDAKAALLFGVTGSGKTSVIQKLTDKCVEDEKDAIILIPEIALTSQAVKIFTDRYGSRVSVLHSGLSAGERTDAWRKINSSRGNIIVGTRSAVFAPVSNLGLIVIDEEQESSFKSDMNPKYHARDIARFRCANSNALLLLSSATPSLESYKKAQEGIYTLVKLTSRYGNAKLPSVKFCDLRENPLANNSSSEFQSLISEDLLNELKENIDKGEQSVLFLNKRGYNAFLSCKSCGLPVECPNCSVSLTYHKYGYGSDGRLVCHYCGFTERVPTNCKTCNSEHIGFVGCGIQMLEEELSSLLPGARIIRMDLDTTSGKFSHDKLLESFRNREADILIGTQMVAKGHDFGNVSLVGVILADMSLYQNDFKASERTFSLLTQVIGRAGRADIPGRAIIQTYSPDNEVLRLSASQDYESFYKSESALRKATSFPPYCDIVTLTFTSETDASVIAAANVFGVTLAKIAKREFKDVRMLVYGPFKAGIFKLVGKYRMRYIIKCRNSKRLRALLTSTLHEYLEESKGIVSVSIDINPNSLS